MTTLFLFKQKSQTTQGFSLLGVIIAIYLIVVGLVALLVLMTRIIPLGTASSTRLVASNLAQEGIEVVRNIRDTNWLKGKDWDEDIKGTGNEVAGKVNYNSQSVTYFWPFPPADIDECGDKCRLYIQGGVYSHEQTLLSKAAPFYRLILLEKKTEPTVQFLKVTSQVKWIEYGRSHYITLVSHLYDWKETD